MLSWRNLIPMGFDNGEPTMEVMAKMKDMIAAQILQGNVYLCGNSPSTSGIAYNGFQNEMGGIGGNSSDGDAFLVKFNNGGDRLWGTYYGGENDDIGYSCDVAENGGVYLSRVTKSATQISSPNAFSESHGNPGTDLSNRDMFLVKFNDSGQREWGTYYGGALVDFGGRCHSGFNNTVYLCGNTNSPDLSQDGFQNTISGGSDAVLAKFNDCAVSSSISVSAWIRTLGLLTEIPILFRRLLNYVCFYSRL